MNSDSNPQRPDRDKLQLTPQEKVLLSQLFINLSRAFIQTHTFGVEHMYAKDAADQSFSILQKIFADKDEVLVCIADGKLCYGMIPVEEGNLLVKKLIDLFNRVRLTSLRFRKETTVEDFKNLLEIFHCQLEKILEAGGVEELAKKKNINTIDINPVKYELVGEDEQIVDEDAQIFEVDEDVEVLEEEKEEPQEPEEQLLQLINEVFKEDASPLDLVEKIKESPTSIANALIEAIRIINKVGIEKCESLVSSVIQKLIFIKNELGIALDDDKAHEAKKEIHTFSTSLEKQLGRLAVTQNCKAFLDEVTDLNIEIEDRISASTVVVGVNNETIDDKKKGKISKSITKRSKKSDYYLNLIKDSLIKRGFSEDETELIIKEGVSYLRKKKKSKTEKLDEELIPILKKLSSKEAELSGALSDIDKIIDAKVKLKSKKILEEKDALASQLEKIEESLDSFEYGIITLDAGGKIIFLNKKAKEFLKLDTGKKISPELLEALKTWPLKGEGLASEEISRIFSCIKSVQKNDSGQIESFLLSV